MTTPPQADTVQLLVDEAHVLAWAYERGDLDGAAVALATIAQAVHLAQIEADPGETHAGAVTHVNGRYVRRQEFLSAMTQVDALRE